MKMDVGAWPRCGGRCAGGGSPGVLPEGLATLHAAAGKAIYMHRSWFSLQSEGFFLLA